MKKNPLIFLCIAVAMILPLMACSRQPVPQPPADAPASQPVVSALPMTGSVENAPSPEDAPEDVPNEGPNILIAYFTRLDNTQAPLDEIIQGGGPYGGLGSSMEDADIDAIASASITLVDGMAQGNVETIAQMIQHTVGGDLFSIQTVDPYPVNYDALIDQGGDEKSQDARPALSTQVENMDRYDVVFIGFPNWWYDAPRAVLSFMESYDFSEKTVIPFATSAGSGFSASIATIEALLPETATLKEGLHVGMYEVAGAQGRVENWIAGLGIQS